MNEPTPTPTTTSSETAPAASTPAVVTTSGGMSARDALAFADSSPALEADGQTPAATTPAAAIAQPDGQTPAADATSQTGEPPQWRWQDIKENIRTKTAAETEARVRAEYDAKVKAFEGVDPSELQGFRVMQAALAGDQRAIAHVKQNPQAVQALRALVAEQQAQAADAEPEADYQTPDGTPVYSGPQQKKWQEWKERQLEARIEQRFAQQLQPVQALVRESQYAQAHNDVASVVTEFRSDPDFKTHEADVKAEINRDPKLAALADTDTRLALEIAWSRVHRDKVLPQQRATSESQTLAKFQQRAVAATVNPSAAAPLTPASTLGNARAALLAAGVD